ncbi:S1 RNA-binding domain-containing protein [Streptomyces sp. M19]
MAESAPDSTRTFLTSLRPGQVRRGTVASVTDFGVFVDLGGAVGMITAANVSWRRVERMEQAARPDRT